MLFSLFWGLILGLSLQDNRLKFCQSFQTFIMPGVNPRSYPLIMLAQKGGKGSGNF